MTDAYQADGREPSEDYIKAMMYVVEEHNTGLSQQEIYDITHTLIMSGFYTGIERDALDGHLVAENLRDVPRGTLNSYPPREPVLKTENQYELELTRELGGATSGPFSEALEGRLKADRDAAEQVQQFDYNGPSVLNWD